jgi:hypothetical protein
MSEERQHRPQVVVCDLPRRAADACAACDSSRPMLSVVVMFVLSRERQLLLNLHKLT